MNMRMQLVRAGLAMAVIGGVATAETFSPPEPDCPLVKAAKPQRILMLDPVQKHPTWIDARKESAGDSILRTTVFVRESATDAATL